MGEQKVWGTLQEVHIHLKDSNQIQPRQVGTIVTWEG